VRHALDAVRDAAGQGAQIILLPELFETPYFCKDQDPRHFELARPRRDNETLARFAGLAAELAVVLPVSFFERAGPAHFNSLVVIDADGRDLGLYRKSHIPDGPGYQEKFYFNPGDTGFRVWPTRYGTLGVAICWDQWFPEAARAMALRGAEILFYPTAIGSEPQDPMLDSSGHWQRVMQGHAGANVMPLIAANRIGCEIGQGVEVTFYGSSFIAGPTGELIASAARDREAILVADLDLAEIARRRRAWGIFRDRRPDLYGVLHSLDGAREA
jgi:N-carbamoylputrescine amidase